MRFYFDLNLGKLVSLPGYAGVLTTAEFKRGDEAEIEIQFCRGSAVQSLVGVVTEMVFVAKLNFLPGTEALLLANTWVHDAITHLYSAPLTQSADLSTVLGTLAFKDLVGELTFTTNSGGPATSQTITARVTNDVWKGNEGTPLSLPTPEQWLVGSGVPTSGSIFVSGGTIPNFNHELLSVGNLNGRASYAENGTPFVDPPVGTGVFCFWNPTLGFWNVVAMTAGVLDGGWAGGPDVATPDLVTLWQEMEAETGVLLVEVEIPATLAPPYFRVAGGFLYIQEAGVWKKTALAAL